MFSTKPTRVKISAQLEILFSRHGKKFVAYVPALDVSTCGDDYDEADKRINEVIEIFFDETSRRGTLGSALKELGWKEIRKEKRPEWVPPSIVARRTIPIEIPADA